MTEPVPADLLEQLVRQRWFAGKHRWLTGATVLDRATLPAEGAPLRLELVEVWYATPPSERYLLLRHDHTLDTVEQPATAEAVLALLLVGGEVPTERGGHVHAWHTAALAPWIAKKPPSARPLSTEQSNSSVRFGDALIMKVYRRPEPGAQPDLEIPRFLTERTTFRHAPLLAGAAEYVDASGERWALATLQSFIPNRGDAWQTMLARLNEALGGGDVERAAAPLARLGEVTAALHLALASVGDDPAFAPEAILPDEAGRWADDVQRNVDDALDAAGTRATVTDPAAPRLAAAGVRRLAGARKARIHGDFHLGQVLERPDGDFAIIDFEGEPARPLGERRAKRSPLRDVAGLLRSLDYACHTAVGISGPVDAARQGRAHAWQRAARQAFLDAYLAAISAEQPTLLPASRADVDAALAGLEVEKAAYETKYELAHRPAWLPIPLAALGATIHPA
jgi:trehalose synthase-fused probable maltokinase